MRTSESLALNIGAAIQPHQVARQNRVWLVQGWGLTLIALMSVWPQLFHYQEYLFFTLLIWGVISSWRSRKSIWIKTQVDLPLLVLLSWILLTIPFSIDPSHSFSEWRKLVVNFLIFYWALLVLQRQVNVQVSRKLVHQIFFVVVIGAFGAGGYSIWSFWEQGGGLLTRGLRAVAPGSGSDRLAIYMVMALPLAVCLISLYQDLWKRLFLICSLVVLFFAEFFAYSRGGWLALAIQGISFAGFRGKFSIIWRVALFCVICLILLFAMSQAGYLDGVFVMESVSDRLGCWKLGVQELVSHPLFGIGFGNEIFGRAFPGDPPGPCSEHAHLHSSFMMYVVGSGIPVIPILFWLAWKTFSLLLRETRMIMDRDAVSLKVTIAVVTVGYITCNFFNYLFTGSLAYLFFILLAGGISISLSSLHENKGHY